MISSKILHYDKNYDKLFVNKQEKSKVLLLFDSVEGSNATQSVTLIVTLTPCRNCSIMQH